MAHYLMYRFSKNPFHPIKNTPEPNAVRLQNPAYFRAIHQGLSDLVANAGLRGSLSIVVPYLCRTCAVLVPYLCHILCGFETWVSRYISVFSPCRRPTNCTSFSPQEPSGPLGTH